MPDSVSDPDPTKDQGPTRPESSTVDASDGPGLTDEQLEKAAGGGPEQSDLCVGIDSAGASSIGTNRDFNSD